MEGCTLNFFYQGQGIMVAGWPLVGYEKKVGAGYGGLELKNDSTARRACLGRSSVGQQ